MAMALGERAERAEARRWRAAVVAVVEAGPPHSSPTGWVSPYRHPLAAGWLAAAAAAAAAAVVAVGEICRRKRARTGYASI